MEEKNEGKREKATDSEILFSKAVKAGKRIYYLDVKKDRNEELYLSITESKKVVNADNTAVNFEKHKVFLYKEDFEKFREALNQALDFAILNNPNTPQTDENTIQKLEKLDFDIEF
ncbi:MAG: DUF3276 family protein [Bacteroidaceae bacterium]